MKLVVLGGAGYIGSHFCQLATENGFEVVIYDDLSTGHVWAAKDLPLVVGNILDTEMLTKTLLSADAVCHFAAKSLVAESVSNPDLYFDNNVNGTRSLLKAMNSAGVSRLIFSSTAATYGIPQSNNVLTELDSVRPINPYGQSKLDAEILINEWASHSGGNAIAFRYFNAAGAMPECGLGEAHDPETHLIPNILNSIISKGGEQFQLFGDDYPTSDGTCVRDYIHVKDIGLAHLAAVSYLTETKNHFTVCNLGSAVGYSNLEVIRACEEMSGGSVDYAVSHRREGDPPVLVASYQKALDLLGWQPINSTIENIVESAYEWHRQNG